MIDPSSTSQVSRSRKRSYDGTLLSDPTSSTHSAPASTTESADQQQIDTGSEAQGQASPKHVTVSESEHSSEASVESHSGAPEDLDEIEEGE